MTKKDSVILVTGGGGYLGCVLVPLLLEYGYRVKVLDRFFWGEELLSPYTSDHLTLINADTRSYDETYLSGIDVVIDLAALSNDPIGELNPQETLDINYHARVRTATLAKKMGVKRYILASTCSVYGFQEALLDELSTPKPVTTYARASLLAENDILPLADDTFCVTFLRQGTLYGVSPRMRFDLLVNTMTLSLVRDGIVVIQDGEQWRPIVHVADSAAAFIKVMNADTRVVNGEIFNVGSTNQNYQIKNAAETIVATLNPSATIARQGAQGDFRSYRASFEKIKAVLQYQPQHTIEDGAREVYEALASKRISETVQTKTIEWYKHLLTEDPTILNDKI